MGSDYPDVPQGGENGVLLRTGGFGRLLDDRLIAIYAVPLSGRSRCRHCGHALGFGNCSSFLHGSVGDETVLAGAWFAGA
ncbi:hypothetical protein D3C73_1557230 [compost metagenome]